MRKLSAQIKRELRESALLIPYCAIYEEDLERFWPLDQPNREAEIARLAIYKQGLCAIFQKDVQR
jgi:hypothetical protein